MNTLINRLVVTGEAEINNANSQREPKSVQINYLRIETIECSKCGLKHLAWRSLVSSA